MTMTAVTQTQRGSTNQSLLGATWVIDGAHTNVEFAVKHLMISTVKGRFARVSGSITLDPSRPFTPDLDIVIDAASLDTREEKRDAHLRSADFFDVEHFPTLTFKGRRIEGDINRQFRLIGDLTIRGVTREVVLQATSEGRITDPWGNDRVAMSATTRIHRSDFGLQWNVALEAGGVLVGDEIKISIETELTAAKRAEAA